VARFVKTGGILLKDVLARVDLPLGEKFHSTAASYYVVMEAQDSLSGSIRLGGTGFDLHGQIRVRGDDAAWQAALGQRRPISGGSAGGEEVRNVGPAGDGVENPAGKLRR
jgi:hypothetical protein